MHVYAYFVITLGPHIILVAALTSYLFCVLFCVNSLYSEQTRFASLSFLVAIRHSHTLTIFRLVIGKYTESIQDIFLLLLQYCVQDFFRGFLSCIRKKCMRQVFDRCTLTYNRRKAFWFAPYALKQTKA